MNPSLPSLRGGTTRHGLQRGVGDGLTQFGLIAGLL